MDNRTPEPSGWHLDKKVPLALILAIVVQTVLVVGWATRTDDTVADHERRIKALEVSDAQHAALVATIYERLARIDERLLFLIERFRDEAKGIKP